MQIRISWEEPIQLTRHKKATIRAEELSKIASPTPGVYFFSRKFGKNYKPFYIGETKNIQTRIKSHLQSFKIQKILLGINDGDELEEIKGGERYIHIGYLLNKPESPKKHLSIVQKYLIRKAIEDGCTLVNIQLTKMRTDTMDFSGSVSGRAIYPKTAIAEAKK